MEEQRIRVISIIDPNHMLGIAVFLQELLILEKENCIVFTGFYSGLVVASKATPTSLRQLCFLLSSPLGFPALKLRGQGSGPGALDLTWHHP